MMKKFISIIISAFIFAMSFCSCSKDKNSWKSLKIATTDIQGNFSPFFAESEGDIRISNQIFQPVQIRGNNNKLTKYTGGISYEYIGDNQVKYIVSIKNDLYFSDGSNVNIDDIIFWYYVLADASYTGPYSDFYQNDIVGLKEYYYDDLNYKKKIKQFSSDTELYNYIDKNYSDGIDVETISGIKRVDDYTCTILFNSRNINAVSEVNAFIVSKSQFSSEYVKGNADVLKKYNNGGIGSGPYCFTEYEADSCKLTFNKYYELIPYYRELNFLDIKDRSPYDCISDGSADIATATASAAEINSLGSNIKCDVSYKSEYVSLCFNAETLSDPIIRRAICSLCDPTEFIEAVYGSYCTRLYCPLSMRFEENPLVSEPYISSKAAETYGAVYKDKKTINLYCPESENSVNNQIMQRLKDNLIPYNLDLTINLCSESEMNNAVAAGKADMWIERIEDGSTCDKYDYYHSKGINNKYHISDDEVDSLTERIRRATGFVNKKELTGELMSIIMKFAYEYPLYQLQNVTLYNTDKISFSDVPQLNNSDGYEYILPYLK